MDKATYLGAINAGGIDHKTVEWQTKVKGAAAHSARNLSKVTSALVMTGASYADLAVNSDRDETGELPWGEWTEFPHIIGHKEKEYARLYVVDGTVRTTYLVDGMVASRDEFNDYLTPSARKPSRPNGGTITVTLDNIKSVK